MNISFAFSPHEQAVNQVKGGSHKFFSLLPSLLDARVSSEEMQYSTVWTAKQSTFAWVLCSVIPESLIILQVGRCSSFKQAIHASTSNLSIKGRISNHECANNSLFWSDILITEGYITSKLPWRNKFQK